MCTAFCGKLNLRRFLTDFQQYMDTLLREIKVEKSFDPMSQWKMFVVEELAAAPAP